jgi:arsenate reductase-like glutaredoxin family protein
VRAAKRLVVAKGKKTIRFDLAKDRPSDDELAALVIGRTGGLRAPAIRVGDTLVIGFTEEGLAELIG